VLKTGDESYGDLGHNTSREVTDYRMSNLLPPDLPFVDAPASDQDICGILIIRNVDIIINIAYEIYYWNGRSTGEVVPYNMTRAFDE
jgi:hypothetical protein